MRRRQYVIDFAIGVLCVALYDRAFCLVICRTVLFTKRPEISISSDTIQNMFSTLVQNLEKEIQVIFCE